jgi:phosphopantothenoylcysteine decarboxylase / phosphopantothenate---cysteine ligase
MSRPNRPSERGSGSQAGVAQPSAGPATGQVVDPLRDARIVLCVSGGIAAYKSAYLTRALVKAGARVFVVMTENAQRFVTPLTFETLSGNPVVTSTFARVHAMGAVEHIDLAEWATLVLVAPATYNLIGKLHAGIADDAVSTFLTAVVCPVFLAPAMNDHMWRNPVNQRNVEGLRALGYRIIDPERGGLACSWEGEGRMREPEAIVEAVSADLRSSPATGTSHAGSADATNLGAAAGTTGSLAGPRGALAGRTVLVSAAGTHEPIDPVRFIGNRSSGKMGYALAARAAHHGARVLLVTGPSNQPLPPGIADVRRVETAAEMLDALRAWLPEADVLLMAAAVADYRPSRPARDKIKRSAEPLQLDLEPTPDILRELGPAKGGRVFVGFALETESPESSARAKLQRKGLDLVVANRVGPETGPDTDTNQVWIYDAEGLVLETPLLDKSRVADAVLGVVEERWARREAHPHGGTGAA